MSALPEVGLSPRLYPILQRAPEPGSWGHSEEAALMLMQEGKMAFPQVWGIALALNIPSLQVVLHGEKKKKKEKKRILRLVSLSLFLVTVMFCFYLATR